MALKYRPYGCTSRTYVRPNELALIHQTEERKNNKLTYYLPFYAVDLVPFGIIFTENYFLSWFKHLKDQHSVIKRFKKNQFTELGIDEFLWLLWIIFGY
jgi:hypothetical protein